MPLRLKRRIVHLTLVLHLLHSIFNSVCNRLLTTWLHEYLTISSTGIVVTTTLYLAALKFGAVKYLIYNRSDGSACKQGSKGSTACERAASTS